MFVQADNQKVIARELSKKHALIVISSPAEIHAAIREIMAALNFYSKNSANILDGLGTSRVVNDLMFGSFKLKKNGVSEISIFNLNQLSYSQQLDVLAIRNHPDVRASMFSTREISSQEHFSFIETLSADLTRHYFAVYAFDNLIGVIYFTELDWNLYDATFGIYSNLIKRTSQAGQKLMQAALTLSRKFKLKSLLLHVDAINYKAMALYERFDFKKVDTFHLNGRDYIIYKRCFS